MTPNLVKQWGSDTLGALVAARVLALGATARIELTGASGETHRHYEVELPRERAAALDLNPGQIVRLKPARMHGSSTSQ